MSAVIYSSISSYTSLERAKIKLSEKKIFRPGKNCQTETVWHILNSANLEVVLKLKLKF